MEIVLSELIKKAKAGDSKSLNTLLLLYKRPLLHTLERIVRNREDAEDILIITLQKAYLNFDKFEHTHAFSTWLFKIGSNTAIDFLRRKNNLHQSVNRDTHQGIDILQSQATNYDNPEESFERQQKISIMKILINKLSDEDRQLILWRYSDELTYEEIATQLNIPVGTIKARLFRIRKLLLRWIEMAFKEL